MFVTWEDFDNHAEETHSAAVRFVEEHFSRFISEVVRCEETMSILNSLVESEDRPTFVYQTLIFDHRRSCIRRRM